MNTMTDPNGLLNSKPISEIVNEPHSEGMTDWFLMSDGINYFVGYWDFDDNYIHFINGYTLLGICIGWSYAPLPINKNYRTISPCTIQHSTDMVEYDKGFVEREKE